MPQAFFENINELTSPQVRSSAGVTLYTSIEIWAFGDTNGANGAGGGAYARVNNYVPTTTGFTLGRSDHSGPRCLGVSDNDMSGDVSVAGMIVEAEAGNGSSGGQDVNSTGDVTYSGGDGATAAGGGGAGSGGPGQNASGGGVTPGAGGTPDGGDGGAPDESGHYPGGGSGTDLGSGPTGGEGRVVFTWDNPAIIPGTLASSAHTTTTVDLAITGTSGGGGTYIFQLQRAPDVAGSPGGFTDIGSTQTATTWTDTGRSASTKYWYQVVVTDTDGDPPQTSNQISVTTASSGGVSKYTRSFFFGLE